jgi:hypothetical protein
MMDDTIVPAQPGYNVMFINDKTAEVVPVLYPVIAWEVPSEWTCPLEPILAGGRANRLYPKHLWGVIHPGGLFYQKHVGYLTSVEHWPAAHKKWREKAA